MRTPKILVVEDEEDILELIHFHLFKEKYEIFGRNGEEALTMAKQEHPDLVLLDLMIPKIHGLEVCQKLKNSLIPAIFPSLWSQQEARRMILSRD